MENYLAPAQRLRHFLGLSSRKRHLKKKKREPHSTPDVTESCWHVNARANARDVFCLFLCVSCIFFLFLFFVVSNKASTYGLSPRANAHDVFCLFLCVSCVLFLFLFFVFFCLK